MLGLARITYDNYRNYHCLYKINLTKNQTPLHNMGATYIEARQNCTSLDCHMKFSQPTSTPLELVLCLIYSDHIEIRKDELNDRNVVLNYTL